MVDQAEEPIRLRCMNQFGRDFIYAAVEVVERDLGDGAGGVLGWRHCDRWAGYDVEEEVVELEKRDGAGSFLLWLGEVEVGAMLSDQVCLNKCLAEKLMAFIYLFPSSSVLFNREN